MSKKVDRTLDILCTFTGQYDESLEKYVGSMSYAITGSTPNMGQIVSATGEIDIYKAPQYDEKLYNARVDVTFTLAGSCTLQNGTVVPVSWAPNLSGDQGAMLLLKEEKSGNASSKDVQAKWVAANRIQIEVNDKNEKKNYYYQPGIVVPALDNLYIPLDPPFVNRQR